MAKEQPIPLTHLEPGQTGRIAAVDPDHQFHHRLADLGFVPGSEICVLRKAPLKDPIEYEVRNCRVCLRRSEAGCIYVFLQAAALLKPK